MKSRRTPQFKSLYARLPDDVQHDADEAYRQFVADNNHPGLNFKHLFGPLYSARVGRSHRALAGREGDTWVWFWIGTHGEYDKLLDSMR